MSFDAALTLTTLCVAGALFASGKIRSDLVAILVVVTLVIGGVLAPDRALAGFGDPVVVLVAALFIVGEGIARSGLADTISDRLLKIGGRSETRQIVLLMLVAGLIGSVMSSTATVALLMPVALRLAGASRHSPSGVLMPLAYGGLISGMMTLIATTPNLVVNAQLIQADLTPFSMFDFTPIGVTALILGIAWMTLGGRRLLPDGRTPEDPTTSLDALADRFGLKGQLHVAAVPDGSAIMRRRLGDLTLQAERGITVLAIRRRDGLVDTVFSARADSMLLPGDYAALECSTDAYLRAVADGVLAPVPPDEADFDRWRRGVGIAELVIAPESTLVGKSVADLKFYASYELHVVAIRRVGKPLGGRVSTKPLASGDTLLVAGAWDRIARLREASHDLVIVNIPFEAGGPPADARRAWVALLVLLAMVVAMATNLVPPVIAALTAALAMIAGRSLTVDEAYRAVSWRTVVLIAGLLPLAEALQTTGLMGKAAEGMAAALGSAPQPVLQTALFVATALLGSFLSNTATAVVMAPLAIDVATRTGAPPQVMAMTVAIACSAAFHTPIASPVVTLVAGPGGYRFIDYVKTGVPMLILTLLVCLVMVPLVVG
ncbi:MAG: SLC13 family permease [Phycisphaerae bacterium]|nr:SLC13 family permease [Phycisphaerae bacterium]